MNELPGLNSERFVRYQSDPVYRARICAAMYALESTMIHVYGAKRSEETWHQAQLLAFIAIDAADSAIEATSDVS